MNRLTERIKKYLDSLNLTAEQVLNWEENIKPEIESFYEEEFENNYDSGDTRIYYKIQDELDKASKDYIDHWENNQI